MAKDNQKQDIEYKNAKPKEKSYYIKDDVTGLRLEVRPNGLKVWNFRYTLNKKSRETTFQSYPTTTLKKARTKALEYRDLINQKIDPIDYYKNLELEKQKEDDSNFQSLAYEWLEYEAKRTTPQTHKRKKAIIDNDALPLFGEKSINDITHQDIIKTIELRLKKTIHKSSRKAKANDGIETANKLFNYLNTIFKYAITKGICKSNPFNDILKDLIIPKAQTVHQPKLTDYEDVKKLVNDIYNYKGHYSIVNALKFVIHIPLRVGNLAKMKWEYINFEDRSLTIPRNLMKIKNINLPDFKVPLSDEVVKILKEQKELTGHSEFVFLSVQNKPISTDWYIQINNEARQSENEALESHLAKYPKLLNSLALIYHICELSQGYDRQGDYDISLNNLNKALELTNVLKEHAKKLYSTYEIEEQHKEDMYNKIHIKIIELQNTSMLPMSFGEVSQKVAGANAKDVEQVAKDVAITKGKQIIKIK